MNYCEVADVKADRSCGSMPAEIIENAITEASTMIDNKLRGRYKVPFTTIPKGIKDLCKDLTVCNLLNSFKTVEAANSRDALDVIAYRCDRVLTTLNEYRDGKMTLEVPTAYDASKEADDTDTHDVKFYAGHSEIMRN